MGAKTARAWMAWVVPLRRTSPASLLGRETPCCELVRGVDFLMRGIDNAPHATRVATNSASHGRAGCDGVPAFSGSGVRSGEADGTGGGSATTFRDALMRLLLQRND